MGRGGEGLFFVPYPGWLDRFVAIDGDGRGWITHPTPTFPTFVIADPTHVPLRSIETRLYHFKHPSLSHPWWMILVSHLKYWIVLTGMIRVPCVPSSVDYPYPPSDARKDDPHTPPEVYESKPRRNDDLLLLQGKEMLRLYAVTFSYMLDDGDVSFAPPHLFLPLSWQLVHTLPTLLVTFWLVLLQILIAGGTDDSTECVIWIAPSRHDLTLYPLLSAMNCHVLIRKAVSISLCRMCPSRFVDGSG